MPSTISWLGTIIGFPFDGLKMLLVDIIKTRASSWASKLKGICTAIWSPSKSALKAAQTKGCNSIALPSINLASKACTPSLWSVGALFKITGCSRIMNSNASQTSLLSFSTSLFACLIVVAKPSLSNLAYRNGLKSSSAIFFGKPHWCSLSSGPTTITDLPE